MIRISWLDDEPISNPRKEDAENGEHGELINPNDKLK
jgi:hypothetical protein